MTAEAESRECAKRKPTSTYGRMCHCPRCTVLRNAENATHMPPFRVDLREEDWLIAETYAVMTRQGASARQIAWACGVTPRTVQRWRARDRARGG